MMFYEIHFLDENTDEERFSTDFNINVGDKIRLYRYAKEYSVVRKVFDLIREVIVLYVKGEG